MHHIVNTSHGQPPLLPPGQTPVYIEEEFIKPPKVLHSKREKRNQRENQSMKCLAQIYCFYLKHFKKRKKMLQSIRKNKNHVHLQSCIVTSTRCPLSSRHRVVSHSRETRETRPGQAWHSGPCLRAGRFSCCGPHRASVSHLADGTLPLLLG